MPRLTNGYLNSRHPYSAIRRDEHCSGILRMKMPVGAQRRFASTCREGDLQWAAMTTAPQTAIKDLVPLIYRARWARIGMSGEVRSRTADTGSGAWEERETFEVAGT